MDVELWSAGWNQHLPVQVNHTNSLGRKYNANLFA